MSKREVLSARCGCLVFFRVSVHAYVLGVNGAIRAVTRWVPDQATTIVVSAPQPVHHCGSDRLACTRLG